MTLEQRESGVMELITAYSNGLITDDECVVMGDLLMGEISIIDGEDIFNRVFEDEVECSSKLDNEWFNESN
jgi:hypothetical protein